MLIGTSRRPILIEPMIFAIAGGADADLFRINPDDGQLLFKNPRL